jgi:antitoxin HicB
MIYPVILTQDCETNQIMARFPDVPEAMTVGKDRDEALQWAEDALLVALSGYMEDGRAIPTPTAPNAGQPVVALPVLVCAKLAIYEAMRLHGISQLALSQKLNIDPRQVRRILDLDHNSRMDQVELALRALGRRLVVTVREAA